ncbi:hypothetical protein JHD50_03150 [Sulfurimonas sp. MAG313]|nr:hypothetical protein [Sulfurimonas sp. MAG313]MDF1880309.1 hypothetical protein [Sulfurimonas sp. MAG313]
MKYILLSLLLISSVLAQIVVIVNPESKVKNLNRDYTKMIFMKKIKALPNGEVLIPLDQNSETDIYNNFYKSVANKNRSRMSKYWAKRIFTGKGEIPEVLGSDEEVIRRVMNDIKAVGYIGKNSLVDGVKVVYTAN